MLVELDFSSEIPIYMQIRNQIVMGIANGRLRSGEKLPTIRNLANEAGINMMTANKAYALLKQEGYIQADRRSGAIVCGGSEGSIALTLKWQGELQLLASEAKLRGISLEEFLNVCRDSYNETEAPQ